ncbi:MAG: LysM peptidoglycan-binding domain-containing protein [bacterium]
MIGTGEHGRTRLRRLVIPPALACALLLAAAPGRAEPRAFEIKVGKGDTPARLAKRYYGRASASRALLLANGLDGLRRRLPGLRTGATLELPTAWSYRIRPGDTFEGLARDYLGNGRQGAFLAQLNGKRAAGLAPEGHVILIPAVVPVHLTRRMSVVRLASLLLDLPERSPAVQELLARIRSFNGLKGQDLTARQRVQVPMTGLRVLGWFLPTGLPQSDPGTARRARAVFGRVAGHLRAGRYVDAAVLIGTLVVRPGLGSELRLRAHQLQCTALVALGRDKLALEAARAVLRLQPNFKADPVLVSPKVRAVYQRARGSGATRRKSPGN